MLLRIKKICQIGGFRDFRSGGSVAFADTDRVTLVHGANTLGKTTFAQILRSLGDGESVHIQKRKSIPPLTGHSQEVEISYRSISGIEKTVKYSNGAWSSSDLKGRIVVFDQDFINTHVILGDSITRDNKESFTDFILGSEGVKLSQQIENDKRNLRQLKQRLPDFRPDFVKGVLDDKDVISFVEMVVGEDTPTLQKLKETDEKRLLRLNRISDFKLLVIPEIGEGSAETVAGNLQTEHSLILAESYDSVSDEAWQVLQSHIKTNCEGDHSVGWLKSGMNMKKTSKCPFCAQDLKGAKSLVDAYQTIFDEKFEEFERNLRVRIREFEASIKLSTAQSFVVPLNRFIESAKNFSPYIQELEEDMQSIETEIKKLEDLDQNFKTVLAEWAQAAQEELAEKSLNIHKATSTKINGQNVIDSAKLVAKQQVTIRRIQGSIVKHIKDAKSKVDKLTPEQIDKEKDKLEKDIKEFDQKIARIEQDKACGLYKQKLKDIKDLRSNIVENINKLEDDQSEYLDEYFEHLDCWFKKLGSNAGFTIEKASTAKGDKKVYSLSVKFHQQKVAPDDLGRVFSESDKRNLALAIFLSRAEKFTNKNEIILVFDDPVVSFDDNRRKMTCREIKVLSADFRQIIVTTHYSSLVKHFYEIQMPATYVQIVSDGNQSCIKTLDAEQFVMSPHYRESDNLFRFTEGSIDDVDKDLRPFMEEHLQLRYQNQIAKNNLPNNGLESLINGLRDLGLISQSNANKLHAFRQSQNPEHHRSGELQNIEEIRTETKDMLDLLYGPLD